MKATIRFTQYDGLRIGADAIVRVAEITHVAPYAAGCAMIMLTNGRSILTSDSVDELESRIDAAEAAELEFPPE